MLILSKCFFFPLILVGKEELKQINASHNFEGVGKKTSLISKFFYCTLVFVLFCYCNFKNSSIYSIRIQKISSICLTWVDSKNITYICVCMYIDMNINAYISWWVVCVSMWVFKQRVIYSIQVKWWFSQNIQNCHCLKVENCWNWFWIQSVNRFCLTKTSYTK